MSSAHPTTSLEAIPRGVASPQELAIRWAITTAACATILAVVYYVTRPSQTPRSSAPRSSASRLLARTLPLAPAAAGAASSFGLIAGVLLAPFTPASCPCHWPSAFHAHYTTISVLLSYSPPKYVVWVGFLPGAALMMLTALLGHRRWYAGSACRRCAAAAWTASAVTASASAVAVLTFPRHFDGRVHVEVSTAFFVSMLLCVVIGHGLVRSEAVENKEGKCRSAAAAAVTFALTMWYAPAYFLKAAPSEGVLSISEHLLLLSEFMWLVVVGITWAKERDSVSGEQEPEREPDPLVDVEEPDPVYCSVSLDTED